MRLPELTAGATQPAHLNVQIYIPESSIRKLGSQTLTAQFAGHALEPETWSGPGRYVFRRTLKPEWLKAGNSGDVEIDFSLDKAIPPTGSDLRELGIVVREISIDTL
jgi:hypothetical protein